MVELCFWLWCLCAAISKPGAATAAAATTSAPLNGNETDRLSLLAFKDGIAGDPTGALGSWNGSLHHCRWRGVTCGRRPAGRVTALNLTSLRLGGRISPSIANLTFVTDIDLRGNQLSGAIPPQLGDLSRLRLLDLSSNALGGEIPSNLSRCSELQVLSLDKNQLVGEIPAALGTLTKLVFLGIRTNSLTGAIPPSLGNLSSDAFQVLGLSGNRLTGGIPGELGRLTSLQTLLVGINKLSGIVPRSLYNLSNIEVLEVVGNKLSGTLPSGLGTTLPNLRFLYFGDNLFEGDIPKSLPNASLLQTIDLSANMFKGTIPDNLGSLEGLEVFNVEKDRLEAKDPKDWDFLTSLTNCSYLRVIDIAFNELGGALPSSIANLSAGLETLLVGGNQISGSIPIGIGELRGLIKLAMGRNHFTGSIPSALGKLENLVGLELRENQLTGEIPSELGNLTVLSIVYLDHNSLSGSIPRRLGWYQQLQGLDISANGLNASIPEELFTFPTLVELDLSDNLLEGSLPSNIGQLVNLQYLNLSVNRLSGHLPATLGDCQSIVQLYLYDNSFEGIIPLSLRNLKGIEVVDLSINNLTGEIPDFLEELRFLQYLNLSFNSFTGEVPKNGVFANASAISLAGSKNICGGASVLQLPTCTFQSEKKSKDFHSLKIIVAVSVAALVGLCLLLLLCSITYIYWMRKLRGKNSATSTSFIKDKHKKISYRDLVKATDGFSGSNLLGKGGFGSVYKGILDDGTVVAIKVLNIQRQGASRSFKSECEALRNVRHRNIVRIISVCSSIDYSGQDFKALVYEFIPNGCLEKWLYPELESDMRALEFVQRLRIVVDVASALDYLHNHCHSPIIHCDLKPSNILLDCCMTAHLGDFGLSRFLLASNENLENYNSTVGIKGSIGYVPPEYGLGSPISTYGDVYSFGIMILELFTSKRPIDDMFKDGLSLQKFVENAFPGQVMNIIDPRLLPTKSEAEVSEATTTNPISSSELIHEYFVSLMRIGLNCTKDSPSERMAIEDVVKEIHTILEAYIESTRAYASE